MIEFPAGMGPTEVEWFQIDPGGLLRSPLNGETQRVNRPGVRLGVRFSFPPIRESQADVFSVRLLRAVQSGIRIPIPRRAGRQGAPGLSVAVDGAVAGGTSLPLKGLPVGYAALEGWWLTLTDAAGVRYAHRLTAPFVADVTGEATATVWPPLRAAFVDGASVNLAAPTIEGWLTDDNPGWRQDVRLVSSIGFTLEERR